MSNETTGVGIIGFGFMGRTHTRAYRWANDNGRPNRLVAIADQNAARFETGEVAKGNMEEGDDGPLFDPATTAVTADVGELLANERVQLVSICTHTQSHVELGIQALEAGKHVVVEKPVALEADEVERLAAAARAAGKLCMPAMCMRFWPGWTWIRETIASGELGAVRSAVFRRLGTHPAWSPEFYSNTAQSGGALFDLHVHDADLVRHYFGAPKAVFTTGSLDHVTTSYVYGDGGPLHVIAEGGWDHTPGFPFHMGYTVVFEGGTAEFALARDPQLTLSKNGETEAIPFEDHNGYGGELRHALAVIAGDEDPIATLDEAAALTRMLHAERESLATGAPVVL